MGVAGVQIAVMLQLLMAALAAEAEMWLAVLALLGRALMEAQAIEAAQAQVVVEQVRLVAITLAMTVALEVTALHLVLLVRQ